MWTKQYEDCQFNSDPICRPKEYKKIEDIMLKFKHEFEDIPAKEWMQKYFG